MKKVIIKESELQKMIKESVLTILENNYKNNIKRMIAAKYAAKKTPEEVRDEMQSHFAKMSAIADINKDRSVIDLDPHEKEFQNQINKDTFKIDFDDLNYEFY